MTRRTLLGAALAALAAAPAAAVPPPLPKTPALEFRPVKPVRFTLNNGMKVYFVEDHRLPVVHVGALVRTGTRYDPAGKTGLADLLARAQDSAGTVKFAPDEFDRVKESLAIDLDSWMDLDKGGVSMTTLSRNLDRAMELFAQTLRYPDFRSDKLEIERQKFLEDIRRRNDDPMDAARRESRRLYFGADHPYGRRPEEQTVKAVSRQDLLDFHVRYYLPDNILLTVSGDLTMDRLAALLRSQFGDWISGGVKFPDIPPAPARTSREVYLFPKDVPQTSLRMVGPGPRPNDPDEYALSVMNDVLGGGGFATRLFGRVRSQEGLAYEVGTRLVPMADEGLFLAVCGTKDRTAAKAAEEVLKTIESMREGPVTDEELRVAKDAIINSFVFRFNEPDKIAEEAADLDYYGYPADYLDTYLARIRAVTAEDVLRVARKWLDPARWVVVAVGDPAQFDRPLSVLGAVQEKKLD